MGKALACHETSFLQLSFGYAPRGGPTSGAPDKQRLRLAEPQGRMTRSARIDDTIGGDGDLRLEAPGS